MLLGWVPFAWAAWIGYLIIGAKARNWKWITLAGGFFVFDVVTFSVMGSLPRIEKGDSYPAPYDVINNWTMSVNLIVWMGNAIGLQWWINRKWLVWRARNDKKASTPWYATATAGDSGSEPDARGRVATVIGNAVATGSASTSEGAPPVVPDLNSQHLVLQAPELDASAVLDINTASQDQLGGLPGIDEATVAKVVAARDDIGGFGDVTELVTRVGVKPHIFAQLQGRISASASPRDPVPKPTTAQPLRAPENGRRLEF
jgi:DNA uptake protein ComE-like DNA-binding protein